MQGCAVSQSRLCEALLPVAETTFSAEELRELSNADNNANKLFCFTLQLSIKLSHFPWEAVAVGSEPALPTGGIALS
jgi:hypothetical protein